MATFTPALLDDIRDRLTLSDIVGRRLKLTRAGREFKGCCPFHKEKTPSFYINDEKRFFHCFGCGAHGDVIGFTMRHDNMSFPEAVESLAAQAGLSIPKDTYEERERYDEEKRLLDLLEQTTVFFEEQLRQPAGREARAYLLARGLTDEAQRRFRLGYAPQDSKALLTALMGQGFTLEEMLAVGLIKKSEDKPDHFSFFRNRVMFPVADRRGRTVAFGGRVMGEGEPKYLNSPDHALFHKGKLLYGLSRARGAAAAGQPLIVVEGYMDVIALAQAGWTGALAPLGTALTEDQLTLLWKLLPPEAARDPQRDYSPILCFDGDSAGTRAAARGLERALPLLTPASTLRVARLPEGEDPDSLIKNQGRGAMQAVLDSARPMVDMLWDMTLASRRLETPEDRATAARLIRQKVGEIRDESLRFLYQNEVEKRLSALFVWQKPQGNFQKNRPGDHKSRGFTPPHAAVSRLSRRPASAAQTLRERVLLALMINHPALASEFGDDLASICFSSPNYEALRQQLTHFFESESHETLDAAALYRHLSLGESGEGPAPKGLADIVSQATYVHAGFARPEKTIEQARAGWKAIWNKYLQEQTHIDLQAATRLWHEDPSDANLSRLMSLRSQMEALVREQDEQVSRDDDEEIAAGL